MYRDLKDNAEAGKVLFLVAERFVYYDEGNC